MREKSRNLVVIAFAITFAVLVVFKENFSLSRGISVIPNTAGAIMMDASSNKTQDVATTTTETNLTTKFCSPMPISNKTVPKPIWMPAFPGSGSTVMKRLVHAITGQQANEIYFGMNGARNSCNAGNVVTCKTHWPVIAPTSSPDQYKSQFYSSAIILVRNPAKALPSYANFEWEMTNRRMHHSQQAPEDFWRRHRDSLFNRNIGMWKNLILRWHRELSYNISFHLPYEQLVNETTGPDVVQKLAALFRDMGANVADDRDLACLWRRVFVDHARVKRKHQGYIPSFRPEQKMMMLNVLDELIEGLPDQPDLIEILVAYKDDIENNVPVDTIPLQKKVEQKKPPTSKNKQI